MSTWVDKEDPEVQITREGQAVQTAQEVQEVQAVQVAPADKVVRVIQSHLLYLPHT
jgi:hypothetical protein